MKAFDFTNALMSLSKYFGNSLRVTFISQNQDEGNMVLIITWASIILAMPFFIVIWIHSECFEEFFSRTWIWRYSSSLSHAQTSHWPQSYLVQAHIFYRPTHFSICPFFLSQCMFQPNWWKLVVFKIHEVFMLLPVALFILFSSWYFLLGYSLRITSSI